MGAPGADIIKMWYWILRSISIVFFKALFRLKVEGLENIPQKTNFIAVANHSSFLDPIVLATAIPRRIHWIALRGIYHAFGLNWLMCKFAVLPTGSSSERAVRLLMKNKDIALFPEGTRSFDGSLREFRRGAALLALKTGRPILPCAILGTYEVLPRQAKLPRFRSIKIKIGKPKYLLKEFGDIIDDICLQEGIFKIRGTIKELINAG
jgi:1-acyl-sn-glycerol-3-phosphate acyltransferase